MMGPQDRLTLSGDPPIEIQLRPSRRARRLSLRVSTIDGRVVLSCPISASRREITRFALSHREWLLTRRAATPAPSVVTIASRVPVEGRLLTVTVAESRRAALAEDAIQVNRHLPVGPQVTAVLKVLARQRLNAACQAYANQLGQSYDKLSLRDTRSRWGSCSGRGALSFSWRLVMAPPEVLRYVAAHEVAHLIEMNHSRAFWAQVKALYPGYEAPRRWLKTDGIKLLRYRFENDA